MDFFVVKFKHLKKLSQGIIIKFVLREDLLSTKIIVIVSLHKLVKKNFLTYSLKCILLTVQRHI